MNIEVYQDSREQEIVELIKEFYDESLKEYGLHISFDSLFESIQKHRNHSFLLIIDNKCVGVLAGLEVALPINKTRIYHEVLWYVSKKYRSKGIYLLNNAMKLLKEDGFGALVMVAMQNSMFDKIDRFYKESGFTPMETHYIKHL
jgi:GNAT superfamily N-acetyltransferase